MLRSPQEVCVGLECAMITFLPNRFMFVHSEFALAILCGKWYAIEKLMYGEVFLTSGGTCTAWAYCILLDAQQCAKHIDIILIR